MFKWARDLSWTRWRSINTIHEVQRSANRFPLKTGSPDAHYVAPDALHRASGASQRLPVLLSDRSPDANSQRPVHRPVLGETLQAPCAWDRMLPSASGASVWCSGKACNLPGYGTGRYPVRPVLASGA